ncbi:aminodeoxychorismate synthase component I [Thorsellia anophelis]|uniref:aminodeoxychorismate synthase n=1 Tax=Thorsellia anophelis DSM 18579 TaxID=1123402 RepID=A0A1I0EY93_9GAMM|nr:aminodeoxychorismate synthase component I [Thorsellia anophelis]SET50483.1 para-aminobenzoate synthetase component 1 [Thorsellia anophelis DSM 18579]
MSSLSTKAFVFNLPYSSDFILKFAGALSSTPWTMLLHSGDSNHPDCQYDILVSHPKITLVTDLLPINQAKSVINHDGQSESDLAQNKGQNIQSITTITEYEYGSESQSFLKEGKVLSTIKKQDSPFDVLDETVKQLNWQAITTEDLPFQGGALGLFGYDLARTEESIPNIAEKIDELPAMAVGLYDVVWIHDKLNKTLKCLIQSHSHEHANKRFEQLTEVAKTLVLKQHSVYFELTKPFIPLISQATFNTQFSKIQELLKAGECYQINLTQAFEANYKGTLWKAFLDLLEANQAPFSSYCVLPQGVVLSASPERFLKLSQGVVSTKPIKGTIPRSQDAQLDEQNKQWLQNSEKNRAENVMIVDLLRNDIGKIAKPGSVTVPKLFEIESFPAVHHLVSTVSAHLPESVSAAQLLKACFPGGSITGAPKVSAMQIIESLETTQRSIYCGTIGYISVCGNLDSNIAIRTLIATPSSKKLNNLAHIHCMANHSSLEDESLYFDSEGTLICFAGGGIVLDSDAGEEYDEVFAKLSKILSLW